VISFQPNVIELPDLEVMVASGPGHVTGMMDVFENPETEGTRSVKIKNTLRKSWRLVLDKFLIIE